MVAERKVSAGGKQGRKLKLKKDTLRDLDAKDAGNEIKGGSERLSCTP